MFGRTRPSKQAKLIVVALCLAPIAVNGGDEGFCVLDAERVGPRSIFLVAARDLSLAVMLASPSAQPVAVAMFDLWANGQGTELAAFGLVWTMIMTVIATGFYLIGRRSIISAVQA